MKREAVHVSSTLPPTHLRITLARERMRVADLVAPVRLAHIVAPQALLADRGNAKQFAFPPPTLIRGV
jgi:hypothetical protein